MPRFSHVAEGSHVQEESVLLVDYVVKLLQPRGGEMGKHVDKYFVGDLEYWGVVVRSEVQTSAREGGGRY